MWIFSGLLSYLLCLVLCKQFWEKNLLQSESSAIEDYRCTHHYVQWKDSLSFPNPQKVVWVQVPPVCLWMEIPKSVKCESSRVRAGSAEVQVQPCLPPRLVFAAIPHPAEPRERRSQWLTSARYPVTLLFQIQAGHFARGHTGCRQNL